MISSERDLAILERIHRSKSTIHQRDLARIIGLSLGMTNSILKRLAQKGLLQVKKVNNRNIQYVVSANGMEEITRRSYRYLKRTIKNVVYYKEAIDSLLAEVARGGYRKLMLVGRSDLDFIVEHLCGRHKLSYRHITALDSEDASGSDTFFLYSENASVDERDRRNSESLRLLFLAGMTDQPVRDSDDQVHATREQQAQDDLTP